MMIDLQILGNKDSATDCGTLSLWEYGRFIDTMTRQQAIRYANKNGIEFPELNTELRRAGMKPYYPKHVR